MIRADKLTEGDLIDLTPVIYGFFPDIDPRHDISNYEYATVEAVGIDVEFPGQTIIYTDQHNVAVPSHWEIEKVGRLAE